nr:PaaI family thioesterase [uncultured Sphingosinicella sp.]
MAEQSYGTVKPEDMAELTGREMLDRMLAGDFPAPPIARTLGFRLVEIDDGVAVFEGDPGPHLLNPLGSVHGGWAMTLIDSATGCALHTQLHAGVGYTTVETKVNMTRAIHEGDGTVRCEGRVLSHGRQIATAEARLLSADGKLLAHGSSTLMILHPRAA